jgi:tetratricopeptide (TPR) repeat protein
MQKFPVKVVIALCSPLLAGGCALFKSNSSAQVARTPVATVTHSPAVGDANYEMGRAYQNRFQYDAAIAAYRKALKDNPRNAEARNALGVIYASQGKHEQAINELMAALAIAPTASHIQNNLGYAYLLTGRNGDAMEVLKVACRYGSREPARARKSEGRGEAPRHRSAGSADVAAGGGCARKTSADRTQRGSVRPQPGKRRA